jgi:Trk-type K+ transport system membrane component
VILLLIQVGGLGIMTLSSLLVIVLSRRLGIRQRLIAAAQTGSLRLGDVKSLVVAVVKMTMAAEAAVAVVLLIRFWLAHDESFGRSLSLAVFHAVSAFNNAGFALFSDSLIGYRTDSVILVVIALAIVAGGLGFPVWRQIAAHPRQPRQWDVHSKLTVLTTVVLIAAGWALFSWFEWTNPHTLGSLSTKDSTVNGFFQSVTTRTAGFNAIEIGALRDTSKLLTTILMFIGGGSGSTAGGIKVTTFALLGWVMWAEVRGERDVNVFRRRVPTDVQRQALTVALMAVGGAVGASLVLLALTPFVLTDVVLEAVSALGTVGLSTGITPSLRAPARVIVIVLMFVGRVGPPTLFAALVLRDRERLYRHPEERIIIG